MALAVAIWFLLSVAFLTRAVRFPHSVLAEMRHPVMSSFVSLFPATTLLVAIGFVPWYRPVALGLFSVGVVIQLAYAARQSAGPWRGKHPEEATTPGLYLPTVANNFISAMACGALGFHDAGLVFLGAGVFSSAEPRSRSFYNACAARASCPLPFVPRSGIQLAPAPVACSARFSVNGGEADTFAKMLFGYGLLQLPVYAASDAVVSVAAVQRVVLELLVRGVGAGDHRFTSWAEQSVRVLSCPRCSPVYFHQRHHRDAAGPYFYLADAGQTSGAR